MLETAFKITWEIGLAERSSSVLSRTAAKFKCQVKATNDGLEVDAKKMMDLMLLAAATGSEIAMTTEGEDEREAMQAIADLFAGTFYSGTWSC